ncbi:TIGR03984 family CRISPR-associated protein [Cyanobacterium aponinum FACHB-4101]|uniref:type III-D CRISPR-associated protein Csx19 n=1 Tax=Cyanobacterium aponinum TaxID=379064 RepID=UPI001680FF96|nr:CRISPR-associated protein Csx19 [Cyanobacterium aponinum]MBD2395141.1 TIGR03984 family CRISPR-associated protein [Cyanobacterium aponinum FACHB-4101]
MTTFLHAQSSVNITLSEAINQCLNPLEDAIALLYSPNFCQVLKLEKDGNLSNSKEEIINTNYQDNYIFEARIFNPNYELRWLNEDEGKGTAAIISENDFDNCLAKKLDSIKVIDTINQQYLLWGEKAKTKLNEGWQRLSAARIGSLDIPLSQSLSQEKRVYLNTREYLKVMDNFGNVRVIEERLINLEVK